ncbi:hypothetical protein [Pedobacter suwonensis]|uniref:hypothetical protein n=1 Tax=Pedobacter suwonensis TaxID=332999 RepID=UPI0011A85CD9|nr:hypothetical protein [Pedobacter suwonensis]
MRKKIYAALYLTTMLFFASSCNVNSTYINREEDKKDAERVANQFYEFLQKKEFQKVIPLLSTKFKAATSTEKLNDYLNGALSKLGEIKSEKLDHWESKVVKGSNPSANYVLYYVVERTKYQSKETVILTAENNQIKIQGYSVNSDGLLLGK